MKRLLVAIALIVAILIGGNFYYIGQIKGGLDDLAQNLQMFGTLTYGQVAITPSGEARINDLRFRMHGAREDLSIAALTLRTNSILGLHKVTDELGRGRVPEELGVSIQGFRMRIDGDMFAQVMSSADGEPSFETAGCGDYQQFGSTELREMGYRELIVDADVDYRIVGGGQILEMSAEFGARDMSAVSFILELGLGAPSRNAEDLGMAFMGASVMSLTFEYEDRGYSDRVVNFCTEHTGLERSAYIDQHLEAWERRWHTKGYKPGPNIISAYQRLLEEAGRVSVHFKPAAPLPLMQLGEMTPQMMAYRLHGDISVNQSAVGQWDMGVLDANEHAELLASQRREQQADSREQTPHQLAVQTPEPQIIAVADLPEYRGKNVAIRLTSGRTMSGQIHALESNRLRLKMIRSGGHAILPVTYASIEEVRLEED